MTKLSVNVAFTILSMAFCAPSFSFDIADLDIVSSDPSYIDRGLAKEHWFNGGRIADYSYLIVKDPTGDAPTEIVERFELRSGDCWPGDSKRSDKTIKDLEVDCNTGRERVEIGADVTRLKSKGNFNKKNNVKEFWYGWSVYFPEDYISVPRYVTPYIGQFHAQNDDEIVVMPIITFVETSGIYRANGSPIHDENELRGRWHKIEVHVRWSQANDGFIRLYSNGEEVFSLEDSAMAQRDRVTFKYGIYRGKSYSMRYPENYEFPTQIVYFSNVRKAKTRDGLAP